MTIEPGLLSSLIEKLKLELQSIVRYEILRGLGKPEANVWTWKISPLSSFEEFLETSLSNNIYPGETITVQSYLSGSFPLNLKVNVLKARSAFLLPSDAFVTQEFLNDLITRKKSLLLAAGIELNQEKVMKIQSLPFEFLQTDSVYVPDSFTKKKYDAGYLATVMLCVNGPLMMKLANEFEIFNRIKSFRVKKLKNLRFSLKKLQLPVFEPVWEKINEAAETLTQIKSKLLEQKELHKKEQEIANFAKKIAQQDYNESMFDQLLQVAD